MKITKRQLKQIIKEELDEVIGGDRDVEWLTSDEMRKSPRSKMMGPSPIAGQEDPSDTEGGYTMSQEEEEEDLRTIDDMISFYQENPWAWSSVARNHYYKMATGEWGPENDPEGVWADHYSDWKKQDFIKVITKIDGSYRP
jgi:hypothetical protein